MHSTSKIEKSLGNTISHQKLIPALQNVQANLVNLKRDRDEIQLKLSDKERELTETRKEVASVIEKKKRLEQASMTYCIYPRTSKLGRATYILY